MRFRTGLIIGLGAGYVLGAKAGRERYEQIRAVWRDVSENEMVASVTERIDEVTATPRNAARQAMSNGLRTAGSTIRDRSTSEEPPTG